MWSAGARPTVSNTHTDTQQASDIPECLDKACRLSAPAGLSSFSGTGLLTTASFKSLARLGEAKHLKSIID